MSATAPESSTSTAQTLATFIHIGERTNVAGSAKFKRLIIAGDYLGMRTIRGETVPSIYRQYATAVEQGVLKYFSE